MFLWFQGKCLISSNSYINDIVQSVSATDTKSPYVGFWCTRGIRSLHVTKSDDEIIKLHNIKYYCYTDDTQVSMTLK